MVLGAPGLDSAAYYLVKAVARDPLGAGAPGRPYYDSAGAVLRERVRKAPQNPSWHSLLALALAGQGSKAAAIREARVGLDSSSAQGRPNALTNLGLILAMVGERDAAIEALAEATDTIPGNFTRMGLRADPTLKWLLDDPRLRILPAPSFARQGAPVGGSWRTLVGGPGGQRAAMFSPDGHWVAYSSDESGRSEVYLRDWPAVERRWIVSAGGGSDPVWSRDGRQLYYLVGNRVMVVDIGAGQAPSISPPRVGFTGPFLVVTSGDQSYDVAADGRLVMLFPASAEADQVKVTMNWSPVARP